MVTGVDDDDEAFEGWQYDESPPASHYTASMVARRWLRAFRRGSRDAWSALLLCLATGTRKLVATVVNRFARPDPYNRHDLLGPGEIQEVKNRYAEEDEEWEA